MYGIQGIGPRANVKMRTAYINHEPHLLVLCTQDVAVGEEFFLDYGEEYTAMYLQPQSQPSEKQPPKEVLMRVMAREGGKEGECVWHVLCAICCVVLVYEYRHIVCITYLHLLYCPDHVIYLSVSSVWLWIVKVTADVCWDFMAFGDPMSSSDEENEDNEEDKKHDGTVEIK